MISSSSSLAFASSERLRFDSSLDTFRREPHLPLGFWPSSRHHPCAATRSRRLPCLRFVPSSGFLDLSTSFSALGLAGLFHPAATSRIHPVQGVLSPRSHPSSSEGACPQAVDRSSRSPTFAGCHSTRTSASRPSSARGRVRCKTVIHRLARRSPLRVPLLQASTSFGWTQFTCVLRSRRFYRSAFAVRDRGSISSSASLPTEARRCVSASPACSSFRAFSPTLRARLTNSPPVALR